MEKDYLYEIFRLMSQKYDKICEIYNLTREMDEAFMRNDPVAVKIIMEMRLEEMKNTDGIAASVQKALDEMPEGMREKTARILASRGENLALSDKAELHIYEVCGKIHRILERTVRIDRAVSLRINGEKSFYNSGGRRMGR